VRLKQGYRFWATLLAVALVIAPAFVAGFLIVEWRAHPPKQVMDSDFWDAIPFIVLPLIFLLSMLWVFRGQRRLIADGQISIGRVTGVRFRRRRTRMVVYEFLDCSGRSVTASSPDNTGSFSQGMAIPVFFNPRIRRRTKSHCVVRLMRLLTSGRRLSVSYGWLPSVRAARLQNHQKLIL